MKIYKYPFKIEDAPQVELPCGHQILHVGLDPGGKPCLWALVSPDANTRMVQLYIVPTGGEEPAQASKHLGSFVQGPFVWHVFLG